MTNIIARFDLRLCRGSDLAQTWLAHEPLVAGALMGLALVRKGHRGTLCFLEAGQVAECLSGRTKTGTVPFADS
jgi:hypothetical protein